MGCLNEATDGWWLPAVGTIRSTPIAAVKLAVTVVLRSAIHFFVSALQVQHSNLICNGGMLPCSLWEEVDRWRHHHLPVAPTGWSAERYRPAWAHLPNRQ